MKRDKILTSQAKTNTLAHKQLHNQWKHAPNHKTDLRGEKEDK